MREPSLVKCLNCGREHTLIFPHNLNCPHCGGNIYVVHEGGFYMQPPKPKVEQPPFTEAAIISEFERGMVLIEQRLAAEAELDKYSD